MANIKDSDFLYKGYNKFHLWNMLFYQELVNPRNQNITRKKRKEIALKMYLELLGIKNVKEVS